MCIRDSTDVTRDITVSVTSVTNENSVTSLNTVNDVPDNTNTSSVTTILTSFESEEYGQLTVRILILNPDRTIKKMCLSIF